MKQCARVVFDAGDPHRNLTIDLILDEESKTKAGMAFCGWWGLLKSNDVLPLVVLRDGRVDFGSDGETDQSERFGTINIHGRTIKPGEMVTMVSEGDETLFRVKQIIDLLAD